jgi:glycerol-3-phosphate dehydrogenase
MKRDVAALANREFDLVVVGGGVYGAAIAWDASLRGLSVAIVDKSDFGSGTSFNNLKTVHGGIRYLQHGDIKRVRESIRERRNLLRIAPHLVHPLPFVVPAYRGSLKRSRIALRLALAMNDVVSWDRNRDADPAKHLPAGRGLTRDECLQMAPGLRRNGLTGGVLYYDAQMHNSDRLTLSYVLSAAAEGAVAANHVEVKELLREGDRVVGVRATDLRAGTATPMDGLEIRGRIVVNAAGPWVDRVLRALGEESGKPLFSMSKAMNLVTNRVVNGVALGVTPPGGGQFLCLIPWRDVCLVGTSHAAFEGEPEELEATEEDIDLLLAGVNEAYPAAGLTRGDVRLVHRGLLPASVRPGRESARASAGDITLQKHYRIRDHREGGIEGLLSVVGVKYTTARDVAEKAVDRALDAIGERPRPSLSRNRALLGGEIEDFERFVRSVSDEHPAVSASVAEHLARSYGTLYKNVLACGPVEPIASGSNVLEAEIRHAARDEMALDLASIVLRRTELGSAGHPGPDALRAAAEIAAQELGWSSEARDRQIQDVEAFYRKRS